VPSSLALVVGAPARMRWGARAWMGGLLALAQVVAFAHIALVEHRTCVLHGEAMHGGHVAPTAHVEVPTFPTAQPADDAAFDGHDHCVCMAPGRERFVLSPLGSDGSSSIASVEPAISHSVDQPALSIAVISLAPKNSPPA
jgi:hypothetical protein